MNLSKLIIFFIFFLSTSVFINTYIKHKTFNKSLKYFILLFIEAMIFIASIEYGFSLFISYVLVGFISCLYLNESFTLKVNFFCYLVMILSLVIRAFYQTPSFNNHLTPLKWCLAYSLGCSIEFLLFSLFSFFLVRITKNTLLNSYLKKQRLHEIQNQLFQGFANIVESKDKTTGDHIKRTSNYVHLICTKLMEKRIYPLEVTPYTTKLMVRAAPFHDLGKLTVPSDILNKPGKLTDSEFAEIQKHSTNGAAFIHKHLQNIDDKELITYATQMALYHHERIDGKGYPFRFIGEEIPMCAKIMSAADILDALLSPRSYKDSFNLNKALQIMTELSGKALDPIIVGVLCNSTKEIVQIHQGVYRQHEQDF